MRTILIMLITIGLSVSAQHGPTPVFVKKARSAEIVNKLKVTGSLLAAKTSEVAGIEAGRVEEVTFKVGDKIKAGQLLARVDDRRIKHDIEEDRAQFTEIEAGIKKLAAELEVQKDDLESMLKAVKKFKGAVSDRDIRAAKLKIVTSEGSISELKASKVRIEARISKLKTALADTHIKAPFDGVIMKRHIVKGSWLEAGGTVATLQAYEIEAKLEIPQSVSFTNLTVDNIRINTINEDLLSIKDLRFNRKVDVSSRNYEILATLKDSEKLIPGMSITAEIPTSKKSVKLLIPSDAIQRNGAGYFVYKVILGQNGSSAAPVPVKILFRHASESAIVSPGIQAGDQIVVEGNERLFPMMPVKATLVEK